MQNKQLKEVANSLVSIASMMPLDDNNRGRLFDEALKLHRLKGVPVVLDGNGHGQTKRYSLLEAVTSTLIGLFVSLLAIQTICYFYEIPINITENVILTGWMTVLSVARSYTVRRLFNSKFWTGGE